MERSEIFILLARDTFQETGSLAWHSHQPSLWLGFSFGAVVLVRCTSDSLGGLNLSTLTLSAAEERQTQGFHVLEENREAMV